MEILRTVLLVIFILVCLALAVIILLQEGKTAGLGSLSGQASSDTYWSKNKGRSKEGVMVKVTTALVILFFVLSAVLNLGLLN